ncbi:conserved hypothetical protein [Caldicellulosiruptor hydrothermalis 108]|uniref:Uncharacterized protein n=1 Tax=Caldicellulosiruptor hydrothermalis (strain DSM 18901 / VKM B-2411 / 108) TaxID=632292 RepID=E4QAC6_CALH1|nr:hypothetical protein [Caldicellulosiruptor hydrothermalis]ADQ08230.1 conserved hypothetical protein [Caldicellulosiruptor hydrothermalis 108]
MYVIAVLIRDKRNEEKIYEMIEDAFSSDVVNDEILKKREKVLEEIKSIGEIEVYNYIQKYGVSM